MGSARPVRPLLAAALGGSLLLSGCTQAPPAPSPSPSSTRAPGWTAELMVTATGAASAEIAVQVLGAPARAVTASRVALPWTGRFTTAAPVAGGAASWTVSVAPAGGAGTVACSIRIDGALVVERRSSAAGRGVVCHAVRPA